MTRRDFQLIADVISETREQFGNYPPIDQLITRMGSALYGTNPRFARGRFELACEPRELTPRALLHDAVTGKIMRGEAEAIVEERTPMR